MLFSAWLLLDNRLTLAGGADVPFVRVIPWVIPIVFVLGVLAAVWFKTRDPERYRAVGRFVHEDA
ncbi:MAG: hypothetical protein M3N56_15880 [Actinomycetota bacterium]|nr:hypothetical protein [Actinomycetota bacterium]